jgi:glycyl-tRNA synthetase (class II)
MKKFTMDEIAGYCNQYGFIFQGSEIYGGLANTWDYGPLGTRLKKYLHASLRLFLSLVPSGPYPRYSPGLHISHFPGI